MTHVPRGRELAAAVVNHVRAAPELHQQDVYVWHADMFLRGDDLATSGTAACLAGWTIILGTEPSARVDTIRRVSGGGFGRGFLHHAAELLEVTVYEPGTSWAVTREFAELDAIFHKTPDATHAVNRFARLFGILNPDVARDGVRASS